MLSAYVFRGRGVANRAADAAISPELVRTLGTNSMPTEERFHASEALGKVRAEDLERLHFSGKRG